PPANGCALGAYTQPALNPRHCHARWLMPATNARADWPAGRSAPKFPSMVEPNLTHDEKAVLAGLLRTTIAADRYPLSPRVRSLKAILDKPDPPASRPEPLPPPRAWVNSMIGKKRGRWR